MSKIIECVPNYSEGKDEKIIKRILKEIGSVEGVEIWDSISDPNHNRTVVTFVGEMEAVKEAVIKSSAKASELIDMSEHQGEHPRIGAIDVIPFIPLVGVNIDECIDLANEIGSILGEKLKVPVYMYGAASKRQELSDLGYIQNIQYEGLIERINEAEYKPDYGVDEMNIKTGGIICGARNILIAFNVNLNTEDLQIAKIISKRIRESGGGLKNVKAMGVRLKEKNQVQVSMDMVDYKKTPLYKVFELIKIEAERFGVNISGSELIGLVPMDGLTDSAKVFLGLHDFEANQIIERRLYKF